MLNGTVTKEDNRQYNWTLSAVGKHDYAVLTVTDDFSNSVTCDIHVSRNMVDKVRIESIEECIVQLCTLRECRGCVNCSYLHQCVNCNNCHFGSDLNDCIDCDYSERLNSCVQVNHGYSCRYCFDCYQCNGLLLCLGLTRQSSKSYQIVDYKIDFDLLDDLSKEFVLSDGSQTTRMQKTILDNIERMSRLFKSADFRLNSGLEMSSWHSGIHRLTDEEGNEHCGTTHCWAGWACHLTDSGKELEAEVGGATNKVGAFLMLHNAYVLGLPNRVNFITDFYTDNKEAMDKIKQLVADGY